MPIVFNITGSNVGSQQAPLDSSKTLDSISSDNSLMLSKNSGSTTSLIVTKMFVGSIVNQATSNVGKYMGDRHTQTQVSNFNSLVGIGFTALKNPYLAIAEVGINLTTTAIDNWYEQKWDRRASKQRMARLGYNSRGEVVGGKH